MNTLKEIEIGKIQENPLNKRSMTAEEILNLKESIIEVGLLHPLAVYRKTEDEYVLISGHKRLRALKELGKLPNSTVQCMVVDKPSDEVKEQELLARANVHRSSPEAIAEEVKIVSKNWDCMSSERRKKLSESYKAAFIAAHSFEPAYIKNPDEYMNNRFRARLEYINRITCLNLSNRSITKYLKEVLSDSHEELKESGPKKEREITVKTIVKSMRSLEGLIESYGATHSDLPLSLQGLQSDLHGLVEYFSEK